MDNSILIFAALELESQFEHLNNWYNLSPLLILFFWQILVRKPVTAVASEGFCSQCQVAVPVSDALPLAMKIMLILLSGKRWLGAEANQTLKHAITPVLG